jgi:hypothetical protein
MNSRGMCTCTVGGTVVKPNNTWQNYYQKKIRNTVAKKVYNPSNMFKRNFLRNWKSLKSMRASHIYISFIQRRYSVEPWSEAKGTWDNREPQTVQPLHQVCLQ